MKVAIMSDTHGQIVWINQCDMVIHCGDFCRSGSFTEVQAFAHWFNKLPAKYKIVIPGNHDNSVNPTGSERMYQALCRITYCVKRPFNS